MNLLSSYFSKSNMASVTSKLPLKQTVFDAVNSILQPVEDKLSKWFWSGIGTLPRNYFSKDITTINYFDKSLWQGIFNERLESIKDDLVFELKEPIDVDSSEETFLEDQLIHLQGIIGKYLLSPQWYEEGLDHLKQAVSYNANYVTVIERVKSSFRSELKNQSALLAECLQGDVIYLCQKSPLTPTILKKILSYYQPLMAPKLYIKHQNWLQECYNAQSLLPPPAIKNSNKINTLTNEKVEGIFTWNESKRNLWKFLWQHSGKLVTLGLAAHITVVQASGGNATNSSRPAEDSSNQTIMLYPSTGVNRAFSNTTPEILPPLTENRSAVVLSQPEQDTVTLDNKDHVNNTKIFILPTDTIEHTIISQELKRDAIRQLDKIDGNLQDIINLFTAEKVNKIVQESKPEIVSTFAAISSPFGLRQECTVTKDVLSELKNVINSALSGITTTQTESNCKFNADNTENCDAILKLIQCGVSHLKNAYISGAQSIALLEKYIKANNDLHEKFQKISDQIKRQMSQKYQQQLDECITNMQELRKILDSTISHFKNEMKNLCSSEIGHGHIETALQKFKEINQFDGDHLIRDIINKAYTDYGQMNNFDNIINFISKLPRFSQMIVSYEALFDKMEKNNLKLFILLTKVHQAKELHGSSTDVIPKLDNLNMKAMTYVDQILDPWATKIRNNDYHDIIKVSNTYIDAFDISLDRLIMKAYANNLKNTENIIEFIRNLPNVHSSIISIHSLFNQMKNHENDLDSSELFMVAYYVKELMEDYNVSTLYKDQLMTVKNNLPDSVRRIMWNGFDKCTIRNRIYNEYLYAANHDFALDASRRSIFTWRAGNEVDEGYWRISPWRRGKFFSFQNTYHSYEYLYAGYDGLARDSERRNVYTWRPSGLITDWAFWRLVPVNNGKYFIIQYKNYNYEYLYPGWDKLVRDENARYVFTWRKTEETPTQEGHWAIYCY